MHSLQREKEVVMEFSPDLEKNPLNYFLLHSIFCISSKINSKNKSHGLNDECSLACI
jgi:hypothetical protein